MLTPDCASRSATSVIRYIKGLNLPVRYQARAVPRVTEENALVSVVGLVESNQGLMFNSFSIWGMAFKPLWSHRDNTQ